MELVHALLRTFPPGWKYHRPEGITLRSKGQSSKKMRGTIFIFKIQYGRWLEHAGKGSGGV